MSPALIFALSIAASTIFTPSLYLLLRPAPSPHPRTERWTQLCTDRRRLTTPFINVSLSPKHCLSDYRHTTSRAHRSQSIALLTAVRGSFAGSPSVLSVLLPVWQPERPPVLLPHTAVLASNLLLLTSPFPLPSHCPRAGHLASGYYLCFFVRIFRICTWRQQDPPQLKRRESVLDCWCLARLQRHPSKSCI